MPCYVVWYDHVGEQPAVEFAKLAVVVAVAALGFVELAD